MSEDREPGYESLAEDAQRLRPAWLNDVEASLRRAHGAEEFIVLVTSLAANAGPLEQQLLARLRSTIPALASPRPEDLERTQRAVHQATRQFLEVLSGVSELDPRVSRLFRKIGFDEATRGHTLAVPRKALLVSTRWAWQVLHRRMPADSPAYRHLGAAGDALLAYLDHLEAEVSNGHALGLRHVRMRPATRQRQLIDALLETSTDDQERRQAELSLLALGAGWPLPQTMVAIRAEGITDFPDLSSMVAVAADPDASPALVLCGAECADAIATQLLEANADATVALTWAVPPTQVADADRWARTALTLATRGVLPAHQVIHCGHHPVELWLHAEPGIRQWLVLDVLHPLLKEGVNSRKVLGQTMLAWLESRDSAGIVATRLGVHTQTVRYRWKRISDLFGDALLDPDRVTAITMTLRATLPLWLSGDQSDVITFRETGRSE